MLFRPDAIAGGQSLLQAPDLLAYGRLGSVYALASAGEITGVDDRDKAAEQFEIEHNPIHSCFHWYAFYHLIFKCQATT